MMIPRPDMKDDESPAGLEVFQLTDEEVPSSHVYMEAQVFTPDSERFVLHRSAHPHGSDPHDPEHRYLLCDLADGGELIPLTEEPGTTGPSMSPDGRHVYYFINEAEPGRGRVALRRVGLDGTGRETIVEYEDNVPGSDLFLSRLYPLSTISSDGKRIIISGFLGDGETEGALWGYICVDIENGDVGAVPLGKDFLNLHPQYCRSRDPEESRDVLIQHNHGGVCDASGKAQQSVGGAGCDIHVIRDDGSMLRDMPWGRDGNEFCQGHQCWVGRGVRAITSTGLREWSERQLIEGFAAPHAGHKGLKTPGGRRSDLSRDFPKPQFCHFATDIAGERFITDYVTEDDDVQVYVADLPQEHGEPLRNWTRLLSSGSTWGKGAHIHPFLSPDGKTGFFNSDESGVLQAYMVRGF